MPQGGSRPGLPGPQTGSPWEQNVLGVMGQPNPQDIALQQQLMQRNLEAASGGPMFQGSGQGTAYDPVAGGVGSPTGAGPQGLGAQTTAVGNAMGGPPGIRPAANAGRGNQAARSAGYSAYKPGAMGQFNRSNPSKTEQPKWMQRK